MSQLACPSADHERWKLQPLWWQDQPLLGFQTTPRGNVWQLRNCRVCGSTLGRRCERKEMTMDAPDGYWLSAEGYARMAEEMERAGHLDLLKYFERRSQDAAVARFDEVCAAAPQLVGIDDVPAEPTAELAEANPWVEFYDGDKADAAAHERHEARADR